MRRPHLHLLLTVGILAAGPARADERERLLTFKAPVDAKAQQAALPNGAPSTKVELSCRAAKDRFADCSVVEMQPAGRADVGAAVITLALARRIEPKDRTGQPIDGRTFEYGMELLAPGDRNPDWLKRPTPYSLAAVYPIRAAQVGRDGSAMIGCRVTVEGYLDRCKVVEETPEGYGFGDAALTLSNQFLMTPKIRGGRAVEGSVAIPINWKDVPRAPMPLMKNRVITDPVWTAVPTAEAIRNAYPEKAADLASGQATLRCELTRTGQAKACETASEAPDKHGFATAARSLSSAFVLRFEPSEVDDLQWIMVDIPFRFRNPTAVDDGRLTDVKWITTLSEEGAALLYPKAARAAGVHDGLGIVDCVATAEGKLADCRVTREQPVGLGFGTAALQAAEVLRMNRWTTRGDAVEGRRLAVPIRLRAEEAPAAKP